MIDPKLFRKVPDYLLGGYWSDRTFVDMDDNILSTKEFGSNKFHGRTHPAIAYMGIIRFTDENDLVYVPFAGSGTEMDVCRKYKRRCIGIDLTPGRDDIIEADATSYKLDEKAQLIIAHPPYEGVVKYSDKENDLSKKGEEYNDLVERCIFQFWHSLVDHDIGYMIIVIGSVYRDGMEVPLDYIWHRHADDIGFRLIGRIVRSFGETKGTDHRANLWKYRLIKFKRFKLGNDIVLIYEKNRRKR